MSHHILSMSIRRRNDILRVRQRSRQLARLLGVDLKTQLRLTACAFEIGWQLLHRRGQGQIRFELDGNRLHIKPMSRSIPCSVIALEGPLRLTPEDIVWAIRGLSELTPLCPIEEMRLHDQELLWLLHEHEQKRDAA